MTDDTPSAPLSAGDVTVVIPTRRRPLLLARCLDSVARQHQLPAAVIVVEDGGVTPETTAVVAAARSASPSLTVLHLASHGGAPQARNIGLEQVTTRLVAFLDDDDMWHEDFLARTVAVLRDNPSTRAVATGRLVRRVDDEEHWYPSAAPPTSCLVLYGRFAGQNAVFHVDVLRAVDGWDESLAAMQDCDLEQRLLMAGVSIEAIPELLVVADESHTERRITTSDARAVGSLQFLRKWWRVAPWRVRPAMVLRALMSQRASSHRIRRLIGVSTTFLARRAQRVFPSAFR